MPTLTDYLSGRHKAHVLFLDLTYWHGMQGKSAKKAAPVQSTHKKPAGG